MPVNPKAIGKSYPPVSYAVGREKIREYAAAVGETNPLHHELEAARSAGYPDFAMLVHGSQEFNWGPVVIAGDEISTTATVQDVTERGGLRFFVFESVSENQRGDTVCTGIWTNIERGA